MTNRIDDILTESDDDELCHRIVDWIVERHGESLDLSKVPDCERVVLCVWNASGVIDNGGFNCLFEGSLAGDPQYVLTAKSFETIGAEKAAVAFERVFRLFPGGKPPAETDARLKLYRAGGAAPRHEVDRLFWEGSEAVRRHLAAFVRSNREAFVNAPTANESAKFQRRNEARRPRKGASGTRDKMTLPDRIETLPHWARVALAGRCARLVLPLFRRAWPNAIEKRTRTIERCVAVAERSARDGRAVDNKRHLTTNATVVVGIANMGLYGSPLEHDRERYPADGNLAIIASKAARVALMAAEAALNGVEASANHVAEAVSGTIDLAEMVNSKKLLRRVAETISYLERESVRQRWNDETPVPKTVFAKPPTRRRPWWQFWS